MEGYLAEIRLFAPDFAPKWWAYCQGQQLAINTNTALFSLLGTTYGGNGVTTFALPNLASRVPVGTGASTTLGTYVLGQIGGEEMHTLISSEMPMHTHSLVYAGGNISVPSQNLILNGCNNAADSPDPTNDLLAANDSSLFYAASSVTPTVNLNSAAATASISLNPSQASLNLLPAGSSQPHTNIQPYLALNYVICIQGLFPSRN